MGALLFIIVFFVICIGVGWMLSQGVNSILFGKEKETYNNKSVLILDKKEVKEEAILPEKVLEKPIYKLPINEILNKIEVVYYQKKYGNVDKLEVYLNNITFSDSEYLPLYYDINYNYLGFKINLSGKTIFLHFLTNRDICIKKNDELYFYFENNEFIIFKFLTNGYKGTKSYFSTAIPTGKELLFFANYRLIYWKLTLKKQDLVVESDNSIICPTNRMSDKDDLQEVLKFMTLKMINELKKLYDEEKYEHNTQSSELLLYNNYLGEK